MVYIKLHDIINNYMINIIYSAKNYINLPRRAECQLYCKSSGGF